MFRRFRVVAVAAAMAALALPAAASAAYAPATLTPSVDVQGGTLDWSTAPTAGNFNAVTLNGAAQTAHATLTSGWGVNDARGTGAGWNVTASASQFTGTTSSNKLPYGSLVMTAPSAATSGSGVTAGPTIESTSTPLDNSSATPVTIASAAANSGQGIWNFTQSNSSNGDLALSIPANANADTYSSTVTFTIGNTP